MRKGFWLSTGTVLWAALIASGCQAATGARLTALDDRDLTQVHGAGLDTEVLQQLQQLAQGGREPLQLERDEQGRRGLTAQQSAALMAALALQTNAAPKAAALAVNAVGAASQLGGTLIALTPVTMLAPIGLPLFGLPSLPAHNSGNSGNSGSNNSR